MNRRNIHIVLDMSRSMIPISGAIVLFLIELSEKLESQMKQEYHFTYQLTWFSGDRTGTESFLDTITFSNGYNYTDSREELIEKMMGLSFPILHISSDIILRNAIVKALENSNGIAEEKIMLIFTDHQFLERLELTDTKSYLRRVVLCSPEGVYENISFSLVNSNGELRPDFPVLKWDLESFTKKWSDEDWNCLINLLC